MVKEKNNYQPRLLIKYNEVVQKFLADRLDIKNNMRLPRIAKIVLNMGIGDAKEQKNQLKSGIEELTTIAGQRAVVTKSKKAISNFKIREGDPVGIRVTLRSNKMYEFFDRFVSVASPRIRDFSGLSAKGFDGRGNYNFGVTEQIIFPEIDYDKINSIRGLNISIITTGKTDEEAYELLVAMGLPIRQKKKKIEEGAEDASEVMKDESKTGETPIDEVEMELDIEDSKEKTSKHEKETPEEKLAETDTEDVIADKEFVSEDTGEGIKDTPEEMQEKDKADAIPIDEVVTALDVEDGQEEANASGEETPDEMQDKDKTDATSIDEVATASDVEDSEKGTSKQGKETPEKGTEA